MGILKNEKLVAEIEAQRKGRNQNECTLTVSILQEDGKEQVILRTIDISGKSPIVVILDDFNAGQLSRALDDARREAYYEYESC